MAFLDWRRFNFFNLTKEVDGGKIAERLREAKVNVATSGHGHLVFGDSEGNIHLVSRNFQISTFRAYKVNVSLAEQLHHVALLITVGEDEPGLNPVIKVWNLDKLDKNGYPLCIRMSSAIPRHNPVAATALCVHENLKYMTVGFADGSVLLYRGEVTGKRNNKSKTLKDSNCQVTGLAFCGTSKYTYLFVSTEKSVYLYNITVKGKEQKIPLDDMGCSRRCSVLAESMKESHFMIGRNDAVYCYTPDGRGPCYAVQGLKIMLKWFRNYLVIVAKDTTNITRVTSEASLSATDGDLERYMVTVLDIQNKFIVFSAPLPEVRAVLAEWGSLYILGEDKKLYHVQEKDLQSKLALLFKMNLYEVSIRIARSQNYDSEGLIDIFRQYGDHLYKKGNHNAAMEQYIKTIGKLEPSYVIRKFLDSEHIDQLTTYLEALHKQGLATEDHTTILLNYYAKINNTAKLKEFIMAKDRGVDFDVELAIKVCRRLSSENALLLAKKYGVQDWYLKILIEDRGKYREALEYIGSLTFEEAEENIRKYGHVLIENVPDETTQFIKKICIDYRPHNKPLVDQSMLDGAGATCVDRANPEDFIHLFHNNSERLVEFLEHLVQAQPNWNTLVYNTLIEQYLRIWASEKCPKSKAHYEQKVLQMLQNSEANYDKDQILILCHVYSFKSGILCIYEERKLYQQIVQYHITQQEYKSVLASCRRFGNQDPNIWVQALWSCAKDPNVPSSILAEILNELEKEQLLAPLLVIDALANSSSATVGELRHYLLSILQAEKELTEKEQELIDQYRQESERVRIQIQTIQTSATIFQGSRCSACHKKLELPSVHFLCQHYYHQQCFKSFAENENECPVCFPENKKLLNSIKTQNHNLHETFHSQLEKAKDGFSLVAEYFGHGVFNNLTVVSNCPVAENIATVSSLGKAAAISETPVSGPGAEARFSLREGQNISTASNLTSEWRSTAPTIADVQATSEIRLRLEETDRKDAYDSSLEENLTRAKSESSSVTLASPTPACGPPASIPPQSKPVHHSHVFSKTMPSRSKQQVKAHNPFEEEYDQSKNPFADDNNTNPFAEVQEDSEDDEDYDSNLNPFTHK